MRKIPQYIGNYRLERKIGRGSTSEVWLARHVHLESRLAAVKILMSQDDDLVERFRREASIASLLNHPHIVEVYDHGEYQSQNPPGHFLCTMLEYVHGGTLQYVLEQQGRLTLNEALAVFRQLADALDYAHSRDIVHRDISPGNILIEQDSNHVLLTDFGIARNMQQGQGITLDYSVMGTPGYWSPEHTRSATEVTYLSDIYSLGVVLYVMLCGEFPWKEVSGLPHHTGDPPPPLAEKGVQKMPADLDRVLQTMLAYDPTRRFQRAGEAVERLDRLMKRHTSATHMLTAPDAGDSTPPTATPRFLDIELEPDDVEAALGTNLVRAPIQQAHERADQLRQSRVVTGLLDEWAARGWFRQNALGRLARPHQVRSRNIYFYELCVLYEHRSTPQALETPDYDAQDLPLEPELPRWQVPLPTPTDFANHPGDQVTLPGTTRVVQCTPCKGKGKTPCPTCSGKGRIYETREVPVSASSDTPETTATAEEPSREQLTGVPWKNTSGSASSTAAAQPRETAALPEDDEEAAAASPEQPRPRRERVLVPCPECKGSGGLTCERCDGVGRLVQQQAFHWHRTVYEAAAHDDLMGVSKKWLLRHCEPHEIYRERAGQTNGTSGAPVRNEWQTIEPLAALLDQAQAATNDTTHIVLSEVAIRFVPVSDMVFDMGHADDDIDEDRLYRLSVYGFENAIPSDWRFLNWERVISLSIIGFLLVLVVVFGIFAFS